MGTLKPQHERVGHNDCGSCDRWLALRSNSDKGTYHCVFDMSIGITVDEPTPDGGYPRKLNYSHVLLPTAMT